MRVLIVYDTTDGQTAKIAARMSAMAESLGHDVVSARGAAAPAPALFDVIFVGGSIHYGFFQDSIQAYVERHGAALNAKQSSLFCVNGTARSDAGKADANVFTDMLLEKTAWAPTHVEQIAGAFPFSIYPLWKRLMMRALLWREDSTLNTSKDLDFTNWPGVDQYVQDFLSTDVAQETDDDFLIRFTTL